MTTEVDYLILGAGPAGLQLGYFLHEARRSYLILEAGRTPGTFFRTFPRHRRLISINKPHTGSLDPDVNMRWDWNSLLSDAPELLFSRYSARYFPPASRLVTYLADFAQRFGLNVRYGARAARIGRADGFAVRDAAGREYRGRRLIVATGVSRMFVPPIPGVELAERYDTVSVKAADFLGQRVLIIGKGNSAFETADRLVETAAVIHLASPHPVKLAWQTHHVGDLRAVNNSVLDTYQLKSQNALLNATVDRIEREGAGYRVSFSYAHADGEREALRYDRVIVCTGFRFDAAPFEPSIRPALVHDDRLPAQTPAWESVNVPDLFFCGTLMQARDFKTTTSAFIHGFRYNIRALHRILECRYHGGAWPSRTVPASADRLAAAVLDRVNRTSALWQQFGFLGDVFVLPGGGHGVQHYEELPVDYVREGGLGRLDRYFLLTLEYGKDHARRDPFGAGRIDRRDVVHADRSNFLHPIVRHFAGGELTSEHHVIEDLAAEWLEPEHVRPLQDYLGEQLGKAPLLAGAAPAGS